MTTLRTAALGLALLVATPALAQDPAPAPEKTETQTQRIERLIKELGSSSYAEREAAQAALEKIGKPAVPALEEATKSDDLEVASRATEALSKIRGDRPAPAPRPDEQERARQGQPMPVPTPDMDEVLKELEKTMPEGFGKLFRRLLDPNNQGGEDGAEGKDEERQGRALPGGPRVKTWTWTLNPNQRPPAGKGTQALGLRTGPPSAALRAQLELRPGEGRVVNQLFPDGHAATSGIELYDVILSLDGKVVRGDKDLEPLLSKDCKVELMRRSKVVKVDVPKLAKTEPEAKKKVTPPKKKAEEPQQKERSF